VVVVAYHGPETLRRTLEKVADLPVTVVDNSSNHQVKVVAEELGARYHDPGRNLGFGAAVNIALRRILDGEPADVLLLNPDAEIPATDVHALAARLREPGWERVGAVSPSLVHADGGLQRVMWPFPAPWRAWVEAVGLGRLNRAEDFAVGAVLLLRWEALQQVGLFDERFFLYAEETDWQRRAAEHGWRAAMDSTVRARHVGGGTSTDPHRRERLFHAGGETYQRKWFGRRGWLLYRAAVVAGCLPRMVLLSGAARARTARRLSLYLRGPRRAAGMGAVG
jgi:GT2 family glycosyltransferase